MFGPLAHADLSSQNMYLDHCLVVVQDEKWPDAVEACIASQQCHTVTSSMASHQCHTLRQPRNPRQLIMEWRSTFVTDAIKMFEALTTQFAHRMQVCR